MAFTSTVCSSATAVHISDTNAMWDVISSQKCGVPGRTSWPSRAISRASFNSRFWAVFDSLFDSKEVTSDFILVLIGHIVTRNEADRYLRNVITALQRCTDHILIYDDQSMDGSPDIADDLGCEVHVRPDHAPAFLDHEAEFRQAAWEAMGIRTGDWIISIDADEFLTGDVRDLCSGLTKSFKVREVFDNSTGTPMVRVDGYWDQITAARLCEWTSESEFVNRKMGCGSLPEAAMAKIEQVDQPEIVHFGYAAARDRESKYQRYVGDRNHNPKHVASILQPGDLKPLE